MQDMSSQQPALSPADRQKVRTGLSRVWHATAFSFSGLKAGWGETAFRQEALAAVVLVPLAFWLGASWTETALLAGSVLIVMTVELLNTAVECVVDRVGTDHHELSGRAKDLGSAAVLVSLALVLVTWALIAWPRLSGAG